MSDAVPKIAVPRRIPCGFTCVIDTREQLPYHFDTLWDGPAGKSNLIEVPVVRQALPVGDYAVESHPGILVERKSKADLYASISQARDNFEGRLRRMHGEYDSPWILVEAEWAELLTAPPEFTKYSPKSLTRTILAWMVRYDRVRWLMAPSRAHAEAFCFRLMERYVKECADIDRACRSAPIRPGDLAAATRVNAAARAKPGPAGLPGVASANAGEDAPADAQRGVAVDAAVSASRSEARRPRASAPTATQGILIPDAATNRAE